MATAVLEGVPPRFPVGTSVGAYIRRGGTQPQGTSPPGSAVATSAVASNGTLTFSGLADNELYWAYALVGGEHRYTAFETRTAAVEGSPVVVAGSFPALNVKTDFGAVGNGSTDDTAAIQAAIDQCRSVSGGQVAFPGADGEVYLTTSALDCDNADGVALVGYGHGGWEPGTPRISYNGATGSAILARSVHGFVLEGLSIEATDSAYDGDLVLMGWAPSPADCIYNRIERCGFRGPSSKTARSLLRLSRTIISSVKNCHFFHAEAPLRVESGYLVAVQIEGNSFNDYVDTAILLDNGAAGPVEATTIYGNTFEPRSDGNAGAIRMTAASGGYGLTIMNNWGGDLYGPGPGTFFDLQGVIFGLQVSGNRLAGGGGVTHLAIPATQGGVVMGNRFEGGGSIPIAGLNTAQGVVVVGNDMQWMPPVEGGGTLGHVFFGNIGVPNNIQNGLIVRGTLPDDRAGDDVAVGSGTSNAPPSNRQTPAIWSDQAEQGNLMLQGQTAAAGGEVAIYAGNGTPTKRLRVGSGGIGFHGTGPQAKPTITGSRGGNAALADLLTKLAAYGLITDSTT